MRLTEEQQIIVEENIPLVHFVVKNFFNNDLEITDCGMIGLVKGVCSYKESKGYALSTYLVKCIKNEIYLYYRRDNKHPKNTLSLDLEYDDSMTLNSYIPDDIDIEKEIIEKETNKKLYKNINRLSDVEKYVIINYYGLYNKERLLQKQIGAKLGIPANKVTKIHLKAIKKLKKYMEGDKNV